MVFIFQYFVKFSIANAANPMKINPININGKNSSKEEVLVFI
jgi:hypothetical protein